LKYKRDALSGQLPQEATEFDKLVQLADARLYEAKQAER